MFDKKLFGYDISQVDETIEQMSEKIQAQQKDIDYLRAEKLKLQRKLNKEAEELQIEK